MKQYKFLKQGTFKKLENFEAQINEEAHRGWRVVNVAQGDSGLVALLEKEK